MTKILLIEDNVEVRENTAEILELANYEVLSASNGKEGVEKAQQDHPDLIVCDIMMPELDGYGVLHILSKSPETSTIPFIFLTAKTEKDDIRKGMNLGADDYITKPFDETELLDAIEIRLKKSNALKESFNKTAESLDEFIQSARQVFDLKQISENRKKRIYKKKSNIYLEGDFPIAVYFINKGKVKTFKTNYEGKEYITGLHSSGQFIGYIDQLMDQSYTESAMAMEDVEISIIPRQDFLTLIHTNREVAAQFIKMLSDNLNEQEEKLLHLAYNSVRQRVAEALLELQKNNDSESAVIYISREDLANMVGTAPESVIRTLSDFKDDKIIDIVSSKIYIKDKTRLDYIVKGLRYAN